eukprot:9485050-Pyramimonas_sp.AAC.1
MIGSKASPSISTKAAESKWLFFFSVWLMEEFGNKCADVERANVLLQAGVALVKWCDLLEKQPRKVPADVCDDLEAFAAMHCNLAGLGGVPILPKHHLFRHLTEMIRVKGSPHYYHTYIDEGMNGVVASIAASTHRARFERMVFRKWGYLARGPRDQNR